VLPWCFFDTDNCVCYDKLFGMILHYRFLPGLA